MKAYKAGYSNQAITVAWINSTRGILWLKWYIQLAKDDGMKLADYTFSDIMLIKPSCAESDIWYRSGLSNTFFAFDMYGIERWHE